LVTVVLKLTDAWPPASSTSNILSFPFRKSTHLSLSAAVRQYINTKYDQHPDMFKQDLEVIDALRRDAVNVREAHPSGVKKLQAYAAQLVWVGGKFPLDVSRLSPRLLLPLR
jgi:programmed cell death 6-interacting protein